MTTPPIPNHINDALALYFDNQASPDVCQTINDWLEQDPANARLFAEFGYIERMIHTAQKTEDASAVFAMLAEMEANADAQTVTLVGELPRKHKHAASLSGQDFINAGRYVLRKTLTSKPAIYTYAAAILLLALILINPFARDTPDTIADIDLRDDIETPNPADSALPIPQDQTVATLTATHNAKWSSPQAEGASAPGSHLSVGSPLHPNQRLTLTAGFAEITTHRGAIAIVEAPATIELLNNDNALHLHSGKLVGICETESSKGFLVRTPHMDITDLGTRFGVDASNEAITEVHVFEGKVLAQASAATPGSFLTETISVGEAVRVVAGAQGSDRIQSDPTRFALGIERQYLAASTGFGLSVGEIDPNWKLVMFNDVPVTDEAALRVTDKPEIDKTQLTTIDLMPVDWLTVPETIGKQSKRIARGYTVRCAFDLPAGHDLDQSDLVLGFQGGRAVDAVRVNGQSLKLPEAMTDRDTFFNPFEQQVIDPYLVDGINTIEIDLYDTDLRTTFRAALEIRPQTP